MFLRIRTFARLCPMFVVLLLGHLASTDAGASVTSTQNSFNATYHAPEWLCTAPTPQTVSGRLLCLHSLTRRFNVSSEYFKANYSNSILFISSSSILDGDFPPLAPNSRVERLLVDLLIPELSLSGILVWNTAARVGATAEILLVDKTWCGRMQIPVLETGLTSGQDLVRLCDNATLDTDIQVTLQRGDANEWMAIKRGAYLVVFRIVATLVAAAAASIALAKLIAYVRLDGFGVNIPQITLWVQFVASMFRTIIMAIDPIYAGLYFNATAAHMTTTISFPLNFISMLLLAMYWSEILDESKIHLTSFLQRLRIPFILASIFITCVEIATSIIRAVRFGVRVSVASTISAVVYIIFMSIISVFFFVFGFKVIRRIRESQRVSNVQSNSLSRQNSSLRRITALLVGSGIFNIIFISAFIIAAVDSFFYTPRGFTLSWTLMYVGTLGSSLTQVLAVKFPDMSKTAGSSHKSSGKDKHGRSTSNAVSTTSSNSH